MASEIIKPHKFEIAKNKIHSLSKDVPKVSLDKFQTKGSIMPWNEHNVTGNEINKHLVEPLQKTFIKQNTTIHNLFNIANEVYNALESLDKEYIQGIIAAIKSAEIASNQAKFASSKALDASTKATNAQDDIKRTIEALQDTVKILKDFKVKVTEDLSLIASLSSRVSYVVSKIQTIENSIRDIADTANEIKNIGPYFYSLTHIKDIDRMWNDIKVNRDDLKNLINTINPFMSRTNKYIDRIDSNIDNIFRGIEYQKNNLSSFQNQVDGFINNVHQTTIRIDGDIASLQDYRTMLESYQHLKDIDSIWRHVEEHNRDLSSFHKQVNSFIENIHQTTIRIDEDIASLQDYCTLLESYQHLKDIDSIWSDVEEHKSNLLELNKKLDNFINDTNSDIDNIKGLIYKMELDNNSTHLKYNKKLNIAYWIGGSAVGLTIINFILQIIGIL